MLTVRDLLELPTLADARCVFDDEMGYDNVVGGFGTFEVEALLDRYYAYDPDDVIGTELSFSGGDMEKAGRALITQMESGIAAVIIRDLLFQDVSDAVKAKARETNTPIFFFHKAYIEAMVTEVRNLIQLDRDQEKRRVVVQDLVNARAAPERRRLFCDSTGLMGGCVACAAFAPAVETDAMTMRAVSVALDEEAGRESEIGCFISQYGRGWVLLAASDCSLSEMDARMPLLCSHLAGSAGMSLACGLGDAVALEDVDLSIVQALQAVRRPAAADSPLRWRDSGWAAFAGAARESPLFARQGSHVRAILSDYDSAHGADLLETVRAFVKCGGVVQATAEELHLHPNSVRNRVVRAANLLGMEGEPERALFAYFTVMLLDEAQ